MTSVEFFILLEKISADKDVKLSFSNCDFFYKLYNHCHELKQLDEDTKLPYVDITARELMRKFDISLTGLFSATKLCEKCGLIKKVAGVAINPRTNHKITRYLITDLFDSYAAKTND